MTNASPEAQPFIECADASYQSAEAVQCAGHESITRKLKPFCAALQAHFAYGARDSDLNDPGARTFCTKKSTSTAGDTARPAVRWQARP